MNRPLYPFPLNMLPVDGSTPVTSGTGKKLSGNRANKFVFSVEFNDDTTDGVVEFEGAPRKSYAGTWQNIATLSVAGGLVQSVTIEEHYEAVRARVTTPVSGGGDPGVIAKCQMYA